MRKVIVFIGFILLLAGCGKTVDIDGAKVDYEELQEEIGKKKDELEKITRDLNKNKEKYDKLQEIAKEEDDLVNMVVNYKVEVSELEDDIKEKQEKLKKLNGEIVKAEDEPIKLNPGTYYFGDDIDTGRYKVTYQEGQHGNIYFHGDEGFAQTFGNDETKEYTFNANDGEDLQADISILLYPVN